MSSNVTKRCLKPKINVSNLPKIHQPHLPGRPILSGCQSLTRALSSYLDFYPKPIFKLIPFYIKDTNQFLLTILKPGLNIRPGDLLLTLDVKSLHTKNLQDEGMQFWFQAMVDFYHDQLLLSIHYLKQMLIFIHELN